MSVAVEEILVLITAAGLTVLIFAVLLSVRQKIRVDRLDPRGAIDAQMRNSMPPWMREAVAQRLETTIATRSLVRRVIRDKTFDTAAEDLQKLREIAQTPT
eukprot:m.158177 g.158177  ORF g.158177 m.158177 type:complete len:101 (-) comp16326_c0_seq1:41-343(-)